ncbi:MAG: helix-turn-helix domain-containing protein [Tetragenococcus koreensis]|nr:helix-turn-helix domain-containing protein [Tetragenococcus koreensis]MDN6317694.1 helix-turn-helix domain-containing protein [Lactococcus lactis]
MKTTDSIGAAFRVLRKERGFTLKEMSEDIISYSYLSKFEKGEAQISLHNFIQLARRLNMTVDEILYFSKTKTINNLAFFQKVSIAHSKSDLSVLKNYLHDEQKLFEKTNIDYHKYNAIMLAVTIKDIDESFSVEEYDPNILVDYLLSCYFWSTYEINLFGNVLAIFSKDLLIVLLKETEKRITEYRVMNKNYCDLIRLIENACIILLRRKEAEQAQRLAESLDGIMGKYYYFEKIRKLFIDSIVKLALEDFEEGEREARKIVEIMCTFDQEFAKNHELELEAFLETFKRQD